MMVMISGKFTHIFSENSFTVIMLPITTVCFFLRLDDTVASFFTAVWVAAVLVFSVFVIPVFFL